MDDFSHTLIQSIPFERDSQLFEDNLDKVGKLVSYGITTAEEMLTVLVKSKVDGVIRQAVINFIQYLNYKPALPYLIHIAKDDSEDISLRRSSAIVAALIGRTKAFVSLKNIALDIKQQPEARINASLGLMYIKSKYILNILTRVIAHDIHDDVRSAAIRSISSLRIVNREVAYSHFLSLLNDTNESPQIRAYAIEGLGFLRDSRAIPFAIQYLTHEHPEIRYMSAYTLGMLGNTSHLPLLEALLNDNGIFETWGLVAEGASDGIKEILERKKDREMG